MLSATMEKAGSRAGVVVRVGQALLTSPEDLYTIMEQVAVVIPSVKPRVHSSYALLLLGTSKVSLNLEHLQLYAPQGPNINY